MTARWLPLFITILSAAVVATPLRADDSDSPHHLTKADGSLDDEKCGICHDENLGLSRSKLETCTLCHAETLHGGSYAHLHADAASVARVVAPEQDTLPLTEDRRLYCGTCHLFHDPAVAGEQPLASAWAPPPTGLAAAVRAALTAEMPRLASKYQPAEAKTEFAAGTRSLRFAVDRGQLCVQCHQEKK